jgi:NAD(P)-dependent dehydrogenase (short-subunit alcohol dehydrogenase family)
MSDVPVALITGAAGGIGAATACEFAKRNYSLALLDCDRESLDRVIVEIRTLGSEATGIVGDLADLAFAEQAVQEAVAHFGRIDVLVNGAIWREIVTMREISVESWERTIRVGLTTPAFLARWVARIMETRQGGVIVNVSSMMSQQSTGFAPAYVACKGALESLTYDLAALYGSRNIRVVAISPGAIDTSLSRDYGNPDGTEQALRKYSESMSMLGRWGAPQEVARAIVWIASDQASYLTGTTLVLDGGWMRSHLPSDLKHRLFPEQFS